MPKQLTDRQQVIYDFIARIIHSRGAPPTIREIMDEFEISSTNGVRTTLAALERKGHIRRLPRLSGDQTHLADHLDRHYERQHRCVSLYCYLTGQKNEHVGALIDFRRGGGPSRR